MSDIPFEFSSELVEIGLVAMADPQFGERLLAALDGLSASDGAASEPQVVRTDALHQNAAA
ncbi:MAG TPA: hypothetical protein VGF89_08240 [Steroidobacteraceae bacterium]|jgi:hypothetical protein